jgi:hypothetical protein
MKSFTIMVIITFISDKHLGWLIEAIRATTARPQLGPTYRPKHQTLDKVHKANNLKCDMPLSKWITHATIWYKREIFVDKMWILK